MINTMPVLTVWYGSMPETNGKSNWTATPSTTGGCMNNVIPLKRSEHWSSDD